MGCSLLAPVVVGMQMLLEHVDWWCFNYFSNTVVSIDNGSWEEWGQLKTMAPIRNTWVLTNKMTSLPCEDVVYFCSEFYMRINVFVLVKMHVFLNFTILKWWGVGVVICLERGADLHIAQLMPLQLTVSCFSKIQIGFAFVVPAHPGSPGQRAVKWVCVWGGGFLEGGMAPSSDSTP